MIIFWAAPVMAVWGFVLSLRCSQQRSRLRRIVGGLCLASAVGMAMFVMPFAWVLRDGIGPGMVISEGRKAIAHFAILYLVALIPVGPLALAAWAFLRTPRKKETYAA